MTKKKWLIPAVLATVLALLLGGWLWYSRPMTIEKLSPELDWDQVDTVGGFYLPDIGAYFVQLQSVPADEADAQELISLLRQATVKRNVIKRDSHDIPDGAPSHLAIELQTQEGYLLLEQYGHDLDICFVTYEVGPGRTVSCQLQDGSPLWQAATAFMDAHRATMAE